MNSMGQSISAMRQRAWRVGLCYRSIVCLQNMGDLARCGSEQMRPCPGAILTQGATVDRHPAYRLPMIIHHEDRASGGYPFQSCLSGNLPSTSDGFVCCFFDVSKLNALMIEHSHFASFDMKMELKHCQ